MKNNNVIATEDKFMKKSRIISIVIAGSLLSIAGCGTLDTVSSTSSTLDAATPDITLNKFVDVRIASLKKEAAAGEGENLDALAQLMGKEDKKAFSFWLQSNYDELFNNLEKPTELISRIQLTETKSSI